MLSQGLTNSESEQEGEHSEHRLEQVKGLIVKKARIAIPLASISSQGLQHFPEQCPF